MRNILFTVFILLLSILGLMNSAYCTADIYWKNIGKQYKYEDLCISSDGKYFAAAKITDSVHYIVFDLITNQEVWSSTAHKWHWSLLNLSPDGKLIALTVDNTDTIRIYDWRANKEIFSAVIKQMTGIYFSPGADKLFVTTYDFDYNEWKTNMFVLDIVKKTTSKVPADAIHDIKISKDVSKLYVSSMTGRGTTWDTIYSGIMNLNTGEILKRFFGYFYRTPKIEINRDETEMLTIEQTGDSILHFVTIDLNTGSEIDEFTLKYNNLYDYAITDDWSYLIIRQMKDETDLKVLDLNTRKVVDSIHLYEKSGDFICNRSSNSIIYTTGCELWERNFLTKAQTRLAVLYNGIEHNGEVNSMDISPNKKLVASCARDSKIKLWDAETGAFIKEFIDTLSSLSAVKFTPDGNYLMSSSVSRKSNFKVWDINTGLVVRVINFTDYFLFKSVFNKQGDLLIFSANNLMVYFMDINSGILTDSIMVYEAVSNLCLSESKDLFLCGQKIFKAYKYSANGFWEDHEFKNIYNLNSVDISPSENAIAYSPANQDYIIVINTAGWTEANTFSGWYTDYDLKQKNTNSHIIKFSPDNNYVFFSVGAVLKVMDLSEKKEKYRYMEMNLYNRSSIRNIAISDDSRILLTSHSDGSIVRWKTSVITGVEDNEHKTGNIEVFPNPAGETLNIKSQNEISNITITDILGKSILIDTKSNINNIYTCDISILRSGVYLMSYLSGIEMKSVKFIKE